MKAACCSSYHITFDIIAHHFIDLYDNIVTDIKVPY